MQYFSVSRKYTDKGLVDASSLDEKEVEAGDWVEVETDIGHLAFKLIRKAKKGEDNEKMIGEVKRKLSVDELEELVSSDLEEKEKEARKVFAQKIKKYNLEMRPITALKSLDDRLIFYFTAPDRVDFRRLVKDLSGQYNHLIRLQHINERKAARIKGGLGPCGRTICCRSILKTYSKVSSDLLKDQGLKGMDSSKMSGACGRLACCLKFEEEQYENMLKDMPDIGDEIKVEGEGFGKVIERNPIKKTVLVELEREGEKERKTKEVSIE